MINSALDFYDDPSGSVLKSAVSSHSELPDFIKTAERLSPERMDELPDDVFALVMFEGGNKMRKFACVDKGNTALSVMYFLANRDLLPKEAQKTAAVNLITACRDWYGLQTPRELEKVALIGAAMGALTLGMGVNEGHNKFKQRQAALNAGVPGSQVMKIGDLTGSNPMPIGAVEPEKKASLNPYVDVSGLRPPIHVERESAQRYCLNSNGQSRYPIDSMEQVKQASAYFMAYRSDLEPHERHQYCANLSARAQELGVPVPPLVEKYGSATLAPDFRVAVYSRQRLFREGTSEHGLLEEMSKQASAYKPEVLAVALERFDKEHGLDLMWGDTIPDPYTSTFGKIAEQQWSFIDGNDYINEDRLRQCAKHCKEQIEELFGEDMADEFGKNPRQIFDSLPLDSKRIIMRVAQQVEE